MAQIRIDKYLADMGIGTRSEVKKILKSGQVTLNGEKIKKPEQKINSETDEVLVNQKPVVYQEFEYYMLNKAGGVVSATKDKKEKRFWIVSIPKTKGFISGRSSGQRHRRITADYK